MNINIVNLGCLNYSSALTIQEELFSLRQKNEIEDTLLLVEHPPTLTLGKRGEYGNILLPLVELEKDGVGVYKVNRGGDVTYHGPGQIVGYPILDLNNHGKSIKAYVYKIEEVFIRLLKDEYGIEAYRDEKEYTGVWVGNSKITAIGVTVKKWVTMHGFAFNVNTNLKHFKWINPCGITDRGVTSLQKIMGNEVDVLLAMEYVKKHFCSIFKYVPCEISLEELLCGKEVTYSVSEKA